MKKVFFTLLTLLLLVNIGCTNDIQNTEDNIKTHREYHVFQGESDNWEGKIIVDYTETFTKVDGQWKYNVKENKGNIGYLMYKGSNNDTINNLYYEVINGAEKQSGNRGKLQSNLIQIGTGTYRGDDIIAVTLKWGDLEETFQMEAIESKIID